MLDNSKKVIEGEPEFLTLEDLLNDERIIQLQEVLDEFDDIVTRDSEGVDENEEDIYPRDLIMRTFKFKKPLTSIEYHGMDFRLVSSFIGAMKQFFFVEFTFSEIFISRFRTLVDVAIGRRKRGGKRIKASCYFPDLEGFCYGYPLIEVAKYCLKKMKYHLIK